MFGMAAIQLPLMFRPAYVAVERKSIDAFKALLEFKPNLTIKANNKTVMDLIWMIDDVKVKEDFLTAVKEKDETAYIYDDRVFQEVYGACRKEKSVEEILICARRVQNPNRKEFSSEHFPPVHAAALFNNASAIKHLVKELNFRPDAWNNNNSTPAHEAVCHAWKHRCIQSSP